MKIRKKRATKWTIESIRQYAKEHGNCEVLSNEYIKNDIKMKFKCQCGNTFFRTWNNFKEQKSYTCLECAHKNTGDGLRHSFDNVRDYFEKHGFILIDDKYIGANIKLTIKDREEYKYYTTFHLFQKHNNPERYHKNNPHTLDNIKHYMKLNNINYNLVSDKYINANSKLKFICDKNHECSISWADFQHGTRCKECYNISRRKSHEQFELELQEKYKGEYSVIGEYKNNRDKILFLHNTCGTYFETIPFSILGRGDGCPLCSISKGERKCIDWLEENNLKYEREYIFNDLISDKNAYLRYDFAVFTKDEIVLIEYDGEFHYRNIIDDEAFKRRKMLDKQKNKYAIDNNIPLIRIPYWEYENTEKILHEALLDFSNSAFFIKKGG